MMKISFKETWSTYQACEQVCYSDIPKNIDVDVHKVFDVSGRLPLEWTDKVCQWLNPIVLEYNAES